MWFPEMVPLCSSRGKRPRLNSSVNRVSWSIASHYALVSQGVFVCVDIWQRGANGEAALRNGGQVRGLHAGGPMPVDRPLEFNMLRRC